VARPRHSSAQLDALLRSLRSEPEQWRYGYELSREVGLAAGTLYPALARLADDGLLEHRWELPPASARPRHMYRLTAAGVTFADARLVVVRARP
jgi:DNA-binding PadR family transcriptional regulator